VKWIRDICFVRVSRGYRYCRKLQQFGTRENKMNAIDVTAKAFFERVYLVLPSEPRDINPPKLLLCLCVVFYSSFVYTCVCVFLHIQSPLRECSSIQSGAFGLPYYCAPLVCVSAVMELLAVWRHNKPKPKNHESTVPMLPHRSLDRYFSISVQFFSSVAPHFCQHTIHQVIWPSPSTLG